MSLSKPTNGGTDYPTRIGLLFDAFNNGNYAFPATQVASADPNTLDDYEEGDWTPTLTFATPGDLTVNYSERVGDYTKIGRAVLLRAGVSTSTFTHTTASGVARISGVPFTASSATSYNATGACSWQGVTKANYTNLVSNVGVSSALITFAMSGSGQSVAALSTGDMPTAGTVVLRTSISFRV